MWTSCCAGVVNGAGISTVEPLGWVILQSRCEASGEGEHTAAVEAVNRPSSQLPVLYYRVKAGQVPDAAASMCFSAS
jgi:hypothetical protein